MSATCQSSGSLAYYKCDGCEDWFWDAAGKDPIPNRSDIVLQSLGHFAEQWQSDAEGHWQICTVCSKEFGRSNHQDENSDLSCDICGNGLSQPGTPTDPQTEPEPQSNSSSRYIWILIAVFAAVIVLCVVTLCVTVLIVLKSNKPKQPTEEESS